MGRHFKTIITIDGIDRRKTGYYSTPDFVADFIYHAMIELNPHGKYVLDPAVGKEELIKNFHKANKEIDSFDISDFGIHFYSNFAQKDFLRYYADQKSKLIFDQKIDLKYDYYIANPPYNCHENEYISRNKKLLQYVFEGIGIYNMYSMFLSAMIDCAKNGALIGLITLDSFLTATMHERLRKQIFGNCTIHHLILCPTDLFWEQKADVRTCILILQKGTKFQGDVKTLNRPADISSFKNSLIRKNFETHSLKDIRLLNNVDYNEFLIGCPKSVKELFLYKRLGKVFNCITGISTGNDSAYLTKTRDENHQIPFYKNPGMRRFYTEPDGFLINNYLEISKDVSNFIVRNKSLILREGITCSSMGVAFSACYLPPQSTFGVNANILCDKREDIWWLISYLNSSLVTYIVRGCLIRSNMITSGYVSRIPIPQFASNIKNDLATISKIAYKKQVGKHETKEYLEKIDEIIFSALGFLEDDIKKISNFVSNLLRSV